MFPPFGKPTWNSFLNRLTRPVSYPTPASASSLHLTQTEDWFAWSTSATEEFTAFPQSIFRTEYLRQSLRSLRTSWRFRRSFRRRFPFWRPQNRQFIAWRQTAEFVAKHFAKGQRVAIVGSIQTRSWEDNDGGKHKAVEIVADSVYFADAKKESAVSSLRDQNFFPCLYGRPSL